MIAKAGRDFASRFALSEATGNQIAQTLSDWATLSKKQNRARTQQDVADFSKRLYGVSMDKALVALDKAKVGDSSGIEAVNTDVAQFWNTSPETARQILKNWYGAQMSGLDSK